MKSTFAWIEECFGGADILVNNAGVLTHGVNLSAPDNTEVVRKTVETNIMSVVYCVREAFNSMKKRNVDGHIVIINSVLGHKIPMMPNGSINMYAPSKFAVTAMVETYRQEFANAGTKVKVTVSTLIFCGTFFMGNILAKLTFLNFIHYFKKV